VAAAVGAVRFVAHSSIMSESRHHAWLEGEAVFRAGVEDEAQALVMGYGARALSIAAARTHGRQTRLEYRYWDAVYQRVADLTAERVRPAANDAYADASTTWLYAPPQARPQIEMSSSAASRPLTTLEIGMRWLKASLGDAPARTVATSPASPVAAPVAPGAHEKTSVPAAAPPAQSAIDAEFVALIEAGLGEIEAGLLYRFAARLAQIRAKEGEVKALMAQAQLIASFLEDDEDDGEARAA
jgi:hypothetical protein